jgi:hypothetical protein
MKKNSAEKMTERLKEEEKLQKEINSKIKKKKSFA